MEATQRQPLPSAHSAEGHVGDFMSCLWFGFAVGITGLWAWPLVLALELWGLQLQGDSGRDSGSGANMDGWRCWERRRLCALLQRAVALLKVG